MGTTSQKLTYLSGTKDLLKTTINYTGANITNDTFRSYPEKLKLGYIDILNNGTDTLFENMPKVSGKGSNLSLTPTCEAHMRNLPYGDTSQDGTPTPSSPVEIENVTGLQKINVCGKNLFDKNTITDDKWLLANGNEETAIQYCISDFIPVISGQQYYLPNTDTRRVKYFKKDKSVLTDTWDIDSTGNQTITIPSNASYIRISIHKTVIDIDNYQFEKGSTSTTYEAYLGNTYEVNLGKNLFNDYVTGIYTSNGISRTGVENKILINGTYDKTGNFDLWLTASNSSTYTENITLLKANVPYTISVKIASGSISNTLNLRVSSRTVGNKSFTWNYQTMTYSNGEYKVTFTPTTDIYIGAIRMPISTSNDITFNNALLNVQIEKGSTATEYAPYFTPIELNKIGDYQDSIKKSTGKNLFDKSTIIEGKYIDGNGNVQTDANNFIGDYIEIDNTKTYYVSSNYSTAKRVVYYNSSKTYISREVLGVKSSVLTIPNNAKYIVLSCYNEHLDTLQLEENSQVTSYEPYGKVWYIEKNTRKLELAIADMNNEENYPGWGSQTQLKNDWPSINTQYTYDEGFKYFSNISVQPSSSYDTIGINTNYYGVIFLNRNYFGSNYTQTYWKTNYPNLIFTIIYRLKAPETTEITNTTLINQLEALYTAKSKEGTTNIASSSINQPMVISASALKNE